MIKLIATDLDGTLLDDKKNIHPSFWEIHEKLKNDGVLFIAASGRQYFTIHDMFQNIVNDLILLAENGTFVKFKDKELFVNDLPLNSARQFVKLSRDLEHADLILCGMNSAYVESRNKHFWSDASQYYKRLQLVDDLSQVEDKILKVTFWNSHEAEEKIYPHIKKYEQDFKVALAGTSWLDITNKTASKGTAIGIIQKMYNFSAEETLVFGDYLNDADMLGMGWYSYAMKNAHPEILKLARFVTRSDNNHNGVVETICELFGYPMPGK